MRTFTKTPAAAPHAVTFSARRRSISALSFVGCTDIKDAFIRGLRTWSGNHKHIKFNEISNTLPCANRSSALDDSCPWELYVGTESGGQYSSLAAYVTNHRLSKTDPEWYQRPMRAPSGVSVQGVDAHWRSVMRFQTDICWYLDATLCYHFQRMADSGMDVLLVMRAIVFSLFSVSGECWYRGGMVV